MCLNSSIGEFFFFLFFFLVCQATQRKAVPMKGLKTQFLFSCKNWRILWFLSRMVQKWSSLQWQYEGKLNNKWNAAGTQLMLLILGMLIHLLRIEGLLVSVKLKTKKNIIRFPYIKQIWDFIWEFNESAITFKMPFFLLCRMLYSFVLDLLMGFCI